MAHQQPIRGAASRVAFDHFRPDRYDLIGAAICLIGVGVIMYAPGRA